MSNDVRPQYEPTVFDSVFGTAPALAAPPDFTWRVIKIDVDPEEDGTAVQLDGAVFEPNNVEVFGPGPYPVVVMPAPLINSGWRAYYQEEGSGPLPIPGGAGILRKLVGLGYVVVGYSQRGLAESSGYIDVAGPRDWADGRKVIDWVRDHTANPDMSHVGLAGASYGAGTSLLIAARDERVKAVAALSAWADLFASLYQNGTRHIRAFHALKALFENGNDRERISPETRQIFDYYLANEHIHTTLRDWALTRSPMRYLDVYNRNQTAIYLATYYHETIFNNMAVVEFFRSLRTPKRLLAQIGDHGNGEALGLAGIEPMPPTAHVYRWFDKHLKGEDDGTDTVFAERMWHPAAGPDAFADLSAIEKDPQRRYLLQATGADGSLAETEPAAPGSKTFEVATWEQTSVEASPLLVMSGMLERLGRPALYNMTEECRPVIPIIVPPVGGAPGLDLTAHFATEAKPLPRRHSAVWIEPAGASTDQRHLVGQPSMHLWVRPEGLKVSVCVYLLAIRPGGTRATMITSGVATVHNTTAGVATAVDIAMQFVNFVLEPGRQLAVVVDADDQNYAVESQLGTTVTILSGPGDQASWVDIPM